MVKFVATIATVEFHAVYDGQTIEWQSLTGNQSGKISEVGRDEWMRFFDFITAGYSPWCW